MKTSNRFSVGPLLAMTMLSAVFCTPAKAAPAGRTTLSLDGQWQIAESKLPDKIPASFTHTVPVPGLVHLAEPPFPDADQHVHRFIGREQVEQDQDYFWYRKTFRAPSARAVAMLRIDKAQFGTAVWLNGRQLTPENGAWHSEYPGCFSASFWNLTRDIRWDAENTLLVRIGADPGVLPDDFPIGSDYEKTKWTPGIYDDVSVFFCDNPEIETIQVAPRIASDEIIVQATLKNNSAAAYSGSLSYVVKTWKTDEQVATSGVDGISIEPGGEKVVTQTIKIPHAHLWWPEDPFLYVLETRAGGDSVQARFGMRELHFDPVTKRAYLNGRVYYLRGANIALHRFFDDPPSGGLPWDDAWVRRLLGTIPKEMHWNYFRFTIGPVPQHWLDVCDEGGLMVQNEFPIWEGRNKVEGYSRTYDVDEMIRQFKDWMRDNWNHPSVVVWDATNETPNEIFNAQVIPAVRGLDLSHRPWEDSYNPPASPGDVEEWHPYLFYGHHFKMSDLETMDGRPSPGALPSTHNAVVINEYGALWLHRDGTPTSTTGKIYARLMGTNVTPRERFNEWAYLLAGETEYWRAYRHMAGIDYFVYLTSDLPDLATSDNWSDVRRLELDPAFADYMGEAFKPLGVYISFFHPTLQAGTSHEFLVKMINDYDHPMGGELILTLETRKGETLAKAERPFDLAALGAGDFQMTLHVPDKPQDNLILKATAVPERKTNTGPTMSRRWLSVTR